MNIEFKGHTISTLDEWRERVFTGKKIKHWKAGYSAYSLADFILNRDGLNTVYQLIASALGENFKPERIHPEHEVKFDKYGRGREHDLAIWGKTSSGNKVFIGLEAKVVEAFGNSIGQVYKAAKTKELKGERTNAIKRIGELLKFNFPEESGNNNHLRYQLLHSTAGTLSVVADLHVLMILVFKTFAYSEVAGQKNKNDFLQFVQRLKTKAVGDHYRVKLDGKELIIIYTEIDF